jgi:predicted metal-binding protein
LIRGRRKPDVSGGAISAPGFQGSGLRSVRVTLRDLSPKDFTQNDGAGDSTPAVDADVAAAVNTATTIYVCITCRDGADFEQAPTPGALLADATIRAAAGTGITVLRVRCLANCKRGLSAAVRRNNAWTYLFGGLDPQHGARALIEGARLFSRATDGVMPWRGRPEALKRGLIARTPPIDFPGDA